MHALAVGTGRAAGTAKPPPTLAHFQFPMPRASPRRKLGGKSWSQQHPRQRWQGGGREAGLCHVARHDGGRHRRGIQGDSRRVSYRDGTGCAKEKTGAHMLPKSFHDRILETPVPTK